MTPAQAGKPDPEDEGPVDTEVVVNDEKNGRLVGAGLHLSQDSPPRTPPCSAATPQDTRRAPTGRRVPLHRERIAVRQEVYPARVPTIRHVPEEDDDCAERGIVT